MIASNVSKAWLQRVFDRVRALPAYGLLGKKERSLAEAMLWEVRQSALSRDPMIDPRKGDRFAVAGWSPGVSAEVTIVKRMMMRRRGAQSGRGCIVPHVAVSVELSAGKQDPRGNIFTLAGLQERLLLRRAKYLGGSKCDSSSKKSRGPSRSKVRKGPQNGPSARSKAVTSV